MTTNAQWEALKEEHELAYFRADVCASSPQSYSIEEKRAICEDVEASTAEVEAALKADFAAMPPVMQGQMLDLLQQADPNHFSWWMEMLTGATPDAPPRSM